MLTSDEPPGGRDQTARRFLGKPRNPIEQCRKQVEACDFNQL